MRVVLFFSFLLIFCNCSKKSQSEDIESLHENVKKISYTLEKSDNLKNILVDDAILILPIKYSSLGEKTKLVIYCHSGGGTVINGIGESLNSDYCRYLASLGYAILDVSGIPASIVSTTNIDKNRTCGSPISVLSYKDAYKYVISNFNIDPECFLISNSNGGLVSFNLVNQTNIPFVAQCSIMPLISIENNAWNVVSGANSGGLFSKYQIRANIISLYNMGTVNTLEELSNFKYDKEKVGVYDPYDYLVFQNKEKYRIPCMIFQTKDDQIVNYKLTLNLFNEMSKRSDNFYLKTFQTGGHTSEPNNQNIGKYMFNCKEYNLTPTVLDVANFFYTHGGYHTTY